VHDDDQVRQANVRYHLHRGPLLHRVRQRGRPGAAVDPHPQLGVLDTKASGAGAQEHDRHPAGPGGHRAAVKEHHEGGPGQPHAQLLEAV